MLKQKDERNISIHPPISRAITHSMPTLFSFFSRVGQLWTRTSATVGRYNLLCGYLIFVLRRKNAIEHALHVEISLCPTVFSCRLPKFLVGPLGKKTCLPLLSELTHLSIQCLPGNRFQAEHRLIYAHLQHSILYRHVLTKSPTIDLYPLVLRQTLFSFWLHVPFDGTVR